jgi:hypothetical protein
MRREKARIRPAPQNDEGLLLYTLLLLLGLDQIILY